MHSISIRHPYAFSLTDWLTNVTLRMSRHRDPMVCYPSIGPFFVHLTLDRFTRTLLHNMQKRKVLCSHICNRPLPSILLKVRIYVFIVLVFVLHPSGIFLICWSLFHWWFDDSYLDSLDTLNIYVKNANFARIEDVLNRLFTVLKDDIGLKSLDFDSNSKIHL